jgi:hypothetical protein
MRFAAKESTLKWESLLLYWKQPVLSRREPTGSPIGLERGWILDFRNWIKYPLPAILSRTIPYPISAATTPQIKLQDFQNGK